MSPQKTSTFFSKTMSNRLNQWDINGCLYLNSFCRKQAVNHFFKIISRLGDGVFWYSLMCVLPVLYGRSGMEVSLLMLGTGTLCVLIYKQLKSRLVRERPFIRSSLIFRGCAPLDRYSFPSGHTMHAACFTTLVLWHFPEFSILLVPFSTLVALSRMVLGLHYPTDVLCGAALGMLLAGAANYVFLPGFI